MKQYLMPIFKINQRIYYFTQGVFDFSFKKKLTIELLPIFYALLLFVAAAVSLAILVAAFWISEWVGFFAIIVVPIGFLISIAIIRAALEYLMLAFGILETVNNMNKIPDQVDNLNEKVNYITNELNYIISDVTHIRQKLDDVVSTVEMLDPLLRLFIRFRKFGLRK